MNKTPKVGGQPNQKGPGFANLAITALLIFMLISALYSLVFGNLKSDEQIPLSQVAQFIGEEKVKKITVEGEKITVLFSDDTTKRSKKEAESSLSETLANYGITKEALAKVEFEIKNESGLGYFLLNALPIILPIAFILLFLWIISRQMRGTGMQVFSFGQSRARLTNPEDQSQKVTFKDVAGVKEAKEELKEIVDFLRNPKKFLDIGARIPKGVLLTGAPGTGKTLLARAVAGEAGVPFFHLSGSEFVEMFVGVGASRVRDLFKVAKKTAPAIVFIDEIDAVGRVRGGGYGGGNDEREQTLNQILVELDGFEQSDKVIVMAASNRPDVLDPALMRPGRFDRRVILDLPDRNDREEILKIHGRGKPLGEDVNLRTVAERTPGFSGADLFSLVNEGAILAAREERRKVSQFDLIRAIEKVMLGPERKSHLFSEQEKKITAYHEAGHALAASVLPYADPVHKVSIVARGHAGGYTLKLPLEDRRLQSRKEFLDDIATALGGYAAEEMIFGDITTGPSNDLQVATALARDMVTKYGMSESLGPVALESTGGRILWGKGLHENEYSEAVAAQIDSEVSKIINTAMARTKEILKKHKKTLAAIADRLTEVETIEQEEFEKLIIANGIMPKRAKEKSTVAS